MSPHCHRHTTEIAATTCDECERALCESCVVHPVTEDHTLCVPCALATAGVRLASHRRMARRQRRALAREGRAVMRPF